MRAMYPKARLQDLLGMLLSLRDGDSGAALTPQEVFDQCMVTFQAGHDTTTSGSAVVELADGLAPRGRAARYQLRWMRCSVAPRRRPTTRDAPALAAGHAQGGAAPVPARTRTDEPSHHRSPDHARRLADSERRRCCASRPGPCTATNSCSRRLDRFRPERFLDGAPAIPKGAWMPFGVGSARLHRAALRAAGDGPARPPCCCSASGLVGTARDRAAADRCCT